MADPNENYKKALEAVEAMLKKQKALNQSADKLKESWNAIASEVFKLDGAAFFKQIPLSADEIRKLNGELKKVDEQIKVLGENFGKALDSDENINKLTKSSSSAFKFMAYQQKKYGIGSAQAYQAEVDFLQKIRAQRSEFASMSDDDLKSIGKHISQGGKLSEIYDNLDESSKNILKANSKNPNLFLDSERKARELHSQTEQIRKELEKGSKEAFSLSSGLKAAFKENVLKEGLRSLMTFDKTIHDVQRNTGAMMDEFGNSQAFASVTRNVSKFGMSVQQAGQYMEAMSNELKTTDFNTLAKATEDFAAIEGATGASAENITGIAGELMRMGQSSEQVKNYMQGASMMAQKFGVSSKRAIDAISRNISKIRTMGFKGGEESLQKMVMTAEKLNMNVDEIFDVAKRARNIEGAMEMASELQLAGGSFANINPMDLLAAARNGPEELQKILTKMGGDIGKFNEKTGKFEFDAVDVDRLQMVADATGQSLDSIQNMIQSNAEDAKKLNMFQGITDGMNDLDAQMVKSGLSDMMKIGKNGKVEFDASSDMAKRMGIESLEDLQKLNGDQLKQKMAADAKTLEGQNLANQDFASSLENFWTSLQSLFHILQPVLEALTFIIQKFTNVVTSIGKVLDSWGMIGTIIKWAIPMMFLFGTGFARSVLSFVTKGIGGFAKNIKDLVVSKGASLFSKGKDIATGGDTDMGSKAKGPAPTVGAGLMSLAEGLKAMGDSKVFKGLLAVALAGPAFLLFVPALPGLLVLALIGAVSGSVIKGFEAVALGLMEFGDNFSSVLKGSLALAAAVIPLLLFTAAVPGLLAMGLVGVMSPLVVAGFEGLSKGLGALGANLTNVLKGSLAMLVIGAALIPFGYAISMMAGVDWMSVLAGVGILALVTLGLIGLGALLMSPAGMFLAVGVAALIGVGIGLAIFGASMMVFAAASNMMKGVDFSWMVNLGGALLSAAPGLLFGGLALLYATPGLITGSIGLLAIAGASMLASQVNWSVIAGMGGALLQASGGLIAFSFAAMMFANPLALVGMFFMVASIGALAAVMVPLASSLQLGADSLTKFAIGLERLSAAADTISDEKLSKLQKISDAMAKASAAGNLAAATAAAAESAGGGGGASGGGGTRKLEIDIKMNGRDVAYVINKDTQIVK